eukprot:scaffold7355_cov497-Prasinococcus_capsulatus_cf.AAC.3
MLHVHQCRRTTSRALVWLGRDSFSQCRTSTRPLDMRTRIHYQSIPVRSVHGAQAGARSGSQSSLSSAEESQRSSSSAEAGCTSCLDCAARSWRRRRLP